jgi:nitrate/nitrite-specific signal transduction histidine kinase
MIRPPPDKVYATLNQYRADLELLTRQHQEMTERLGDAYRALKSAVEGRDKARHKQNVYLALLLLASLLLVLTVLFCGRI